MTDLPSPTDVAFVMNVAAGPSPLGAQFAGRVPTRQALQGLEQATRMPAAPTPESYFADTSPRLTIASITRGLGMDPSTELVWQRFLNGALNGATSEVGARQSIIGKMRDERLDSGLQKALLGRSLSFYRSCVAGRRGRLGKSFVMSKAGGEGSRGGHVIGHTKSGKPIYADGGSSGGYTKEDHSDAASAHVGEYLSHLKTGDQAKMDAHQNLKNIHTNLQEGKPALLTRRVRGRAIAVTPTEHFPATSANKRRPPTKRAKPAASQSTPTPSPRAATNTQVGIGHPAYNTAHKTEEFADRVSRGKYDADDDEDDGYGSPSLDHEVQQGHAAAAEAVQRAFPHFTADDHRAAAQHHEANYEKHAAAHQYGEQAYQTSMRHLGAARAHNTLARKTTNKSMSRGGAFFMLKSGGEGDHKSLDKAASTALKPGVHAPTIGRTGTGHPIFANHPAGAAGYTPKDHADAAQAHMAHAAKLQGPAKMHHLHVAGYHAQRAGLGKSTFVMSKAGGEGSRGGKVVGHTKSGAPIYESAGSARTAKTPMSHTGSGAPVPGTAHPASQALIDARGNAGRLQSAAKTHFADYTGQDHRDLATHYKAAAKDAHPGSEGRAIHESLAQAHSDLGASKGKYGTSFLHKTGKILGHTRTGKAIAADSGGKGKNFTAKDHEDAAAAHQSESMMHYHEASNHPEGSAKHNAAVAAAGRHNMARMAHRDEATAIARRGVGTTPARNAKVLKRTTEKSMRSEAAFVLEESLSKAQGGEGSRGGKIIGHTKRITPHTEKSMRSEAADLLSESLSKGQSGGLPTIDAPDADDLYERDEVRGGPFPGPNAGDAQGAGNSGGKDYGDVPTPATRAGQNPGTAATTGSSDDGNWKAGVPNVPEIDDWHKVPRLKEEASTAKSLSKAEGDHGGHIIGHTKSGKPIYASGGSGGAKFSNQDHVDAGKAHAAKAKEYKQAFVDHSEGANLGSDAQIDSHVKVAKKISDARKHHEAQARAHNDAAAGGHARVRFSGPDEGEKSMTKSRVVQNGLVTYVHGGLDDRAAAMVKGGQFYHGGDSPQLHGPRNALTQHTMCKSCDTQRPTLLTACPACGDGDVLRRSVQGDPSRPRVAGQPTPFGGRLAPMRKSEVYAPAGISLSDEG